MTRSKIALAIGLALAAHYAAAADTAFDNFTPLSGSSPANPVNSPLEATPLTLSSPNFSQRTIADRTTQLNNGEFNSGNWDMITINENGPEAGRYLFSVFETGQAGIHRTDLQTGTTETIWQSPTSTAPFNHVAFDASYWTPWGTYITAEENWSTAAGGATDNPYGRLFEVTNPLKASGTVDVVHRNVIPRTSHEGIQFDSAGSMYFIDELNGGSLYRYTSAAGIGDDYFAAGTTAVLRIGDGNTPNATGAATWVDFTDAAGAALAGAITITDPLFVESVDARNTTDLAAFKGTDYQRPEDLQIQIASTGDELLYMTTTTTNQIYAFNVTTGVMSLFADTNTIDLATGVAVGGGAGGLASPDNLAIDAAGNIYIIEDQPGGQADIWFAKDINLDGDLLDAGEGLALWASMDTAGAEPTGLYFDPFDPNRAWVNIQHPSSGVDRLIEITAAPVPVPAALPLLISALGGLGFLGMRRKTS